MAPRLTVPVADSDPRMSQLARDVGATLGARYESIVTQFAAHNRQFELDIDSYVQRVVDDVQQYVHDTLVDTTWPACPRHGNHPLWLQDGSWRCEADSVAVARLGELRGTEA